MASTYLTRTMGTPTNATKQTLSVWIKLSANSDYGGIVTSQYESLAGGAGHWTGNNESIYGNWTYNGTANGETRTTALGRDFSGWYHIVSTQDASQSGTDKSKIWINGVLQTDFASDNRSNFSTHASWFANGKTLHIGRKFDGTLYFNGIMSHLHLCDGYAYQASDFGSFDSTTGEWKINTAPSVNYGNQGFFILKDNAGTTDLSGNGNNFTVSGGTLTKTEDCPSNVFATMNSLNYTSSAIAYANGNTKPQYPGSWIASLGTLGAKAGKYYWEAKVASGNNQNLFYGISTAAVDLDTSPQNKAGVISQHINGDRYVDTTYTASAAEALTNGDILGVALDLDSGTKTVKFYKNGSLLTSSSSVNLTSTFDDEFIFPIFIGNNSSASSAWEVNFGNGYFGTTAVSSAGTNASNLGIFEYDVPSGYTALCTKGLNE